VVYGEVEEYVRVAVERLTLNLKQEKMTPVLEDKLERFMAELMQINSVSVEQLVRRNRQEANKRRESRLEVSEKGRESRKVEQYQTELSASKNAIAREQYASIMQRLTGEARMSKSFAVAGPSSASQDARFRTVYATTPTKRRKIFD
jgi:thioredoxin-like negative regulator of GroEL